MRTMHRHSGVTWGHITHAHTRYRHPNSQYRGSSRLPLPLRDVIPQPLESHPPQVPRETPITP